MQPKVNLGLSLFGLSVEVQDVLSYFGRRTKTAGPFVIVERLEGKALETDHRAVNGWQPWLGTLHGGSGQRWLFERTANTDEIAIRSAENGLVLDRTWDEVDHAPLTLWERHDRAHQRWRLRRTPDGLAWSIASAADGRVIDTGRLIDRSEDTHPWMYTSHGGRHQQFLVLPIG